MLYGTIKKSYAFKYQERNSDGDYECRHDFILNTQRNYLPNG